MEKYLGVKMIEAKPMKLGAYNAYRGWKIPDNENPDRDGYLVKYEDGYESWSPKSVFDVAYRRIDNMTFGLAIEALKQGKKVARKEWNRKKIELLSVSYINPEGMVVNADKAIAVVGIYGAPAAWLATEEDILSEDWVVVE